MRKLLGYGFSTVAVLLVVWVIIAWNEWLPRTTQVQHDALALMNAPSDRVVGQGNAWELFWLLPYHVPEAARADVLAEDIENLDARYDRSGLDAYVSVAEGRYPRWLAKSGGRGKFCVGEQPCLGAVRADPQGAEAEWQASNELLQAGRRVADYDHFRTPHRPSLSAPIPMFGQIQPAQLLDSVRMFEQGSADEALDRLCLDTAAWRRLKGRSDSLIFEMFNAAQLRRAAVLYAELRAELPLDHPVPESCVRAFAPPQPIERQSCDIYRSEFRMLEAGMRPRMLVQGHGEGEAPAFVRTWFADLAVNQRAGAARMAEWFAAACAAIDMPAERADAAPRSGTGRCSTVEKIFDPLGCILSDIATPAYVDYWKRDRDWEASLHLLALAEQLASAEDPEAAFEAAGALRQVFEQETRFVDGRVAFKLFRPNSNSEPWWSFPLPGSAVSAKAQPSAAPAESD